MEDLLIPSWEGFLVIVGFVLGIIVAGLVILFG